jgi:hypothetical protein
MALTKVIGSGIGTVTDNVVITSDDPTITMTDSSGTNDIGTIQSTSGALIITARDGSSDGEIIFKKTDGSATDETMRIKNDGNIGIGMTPNTNYGKEVNILSGTSNARIKLANSTTGSSNTDGFDLIADANGAYIWNRENDLLAFATNNDEKLRLHSNGVFACSAGVALGVGVNNTSSNVLDDYEVGTWTPTLLGSSSNPTVSYNQTSATYIKIGQSVHLHGRILATSISGGSGTALIGGLPFATSGSYRNAGTIGYISNVSLGTGYTQFGLNPDAGTSTMRLVQSGSGIGANVISVGVIANNFDLTFSHSYRV